MTSTMKSEPGVPSACTDTFGAPVSAAATAAEGRSAEGRMAAVGAAAEVAALAASSGGAALSAPVTATPARNLRRSNLVRESARSMPASHTLAYNDGMLIQRQIGRHGAIGISAPTVME